MIENAEQAHRAVDELLELLHPLQLMPRYFVAFREIRRAIGRAAAIEQGVS
jgi:hypothetical protein